MGGGEAIMICIDTSTWMMTGNSFMEQADAVGLYCSNKFESHPETVVGLCGFSDRCMTHLTHPDRDLSQIMRVVSEFNEVSLGGYLLLLDGVSNAYDVWFCYSGKELGKHLPKRIVVFAGGPLYEKMDDMQILAEGLKEKNVACDAISFGDPERNKQKLFETLIALADKNGNCNHVHVPPKSSVRAALSRSKIIQSGSKQNINALSSSQIIGSGPAPLFASLPVQQESSKQNINAPRYLRSGPATYASLLMQPESSKQNINAVPRLMKRLDKKAAANYPKSLYQLVADLKPENVKPNSQPETLDERFEMQKGKQEIDMASFTGVTTPGKRTMQRNRR